MTFEDRDLDREITFFSSHVVLIFFSQLIESLIDRVDLTESETQSSLEFLLNEANEALISAFLVLLRAKGETYEEVSQSTRMKTYTSTRLQ